MSKEKYHDIHIPKELDTAISVGVSQALLQDINPKRSYLKKGLVASLICFVGLTVASPTFASQLPVVREVFALIEQNIYYPGHYSQYATSVNETVTSNGVSMTLSEIFSDGQKLYVTYVVKRDKPFTYFENDLGMKTRQLLVGELYAKVSFGEMNGSGIAGFQGGFIDNHTFVGMQEFDLNPFEQEVPSEFTFQTRFYNVENYPYTDALPTDESRGTWAFKVPVKVNESLRTEFKVDVSENGGEVYRIAQTPFDVIVELKLPNPDESSNYDVRLYDEVGEELKFKHSKLTDEGRTIATFAAPKEPLTKVRVEMSHYNLIPIDENTFEHTSSEIVFDQWIDLTK